MREKYFVFVFFSEFFSNFRRNFFRLLAKKLQEVFKTTFYVSRGTVCGLIFFLKFWIVLDFLQKPSAWFSKLYLRIQSKIAEETVSLFFFSEFFFGFWAKSFSDFRPKNFKKMWKVTSACPEEQFVAWNFFRSFESFRIFCRNLWHGFQKSIYVSRVKIAGKIVGFCFFFRIFFRLFSETFSDFRPKNFKKFSKLPFTCPEEQFVAWCFFFLKFRIVLDFLQKPSAWFSKFYLRVQSKNFGRNSFLIFLFRIFSDFERKFFRLLAKKFQEVFKTTFYVSRGPVCGLKFFSKVLNRFGISAETFGMVLKILSTCPE